MASISKSQFIEMFGNINENDKGFPVVKFETAFTIRDDLRKPINSEKRSKMHEGAKYPYYGANGLVDVVNEYLMDCEAICLAEDCGVYGPNEQSSYIVSGKCWVNNHAHVLFTNKCCNIAYTNAFFTMCDMNEYISGTTRNKLTQQDMKKIPIILPPIELQNFFSDFANQVDKSKLTYMLVIF